MDFHAEKPIFLQIADAICDRILSGQLKGDERIPSVREYGAEVGVNPNTMMRTYEKLTADEIIYNKRGIGYFVSPEARDKILAAQKAEFITKDVPAILRKMKLLGLDTKVFKEE
jgi:DNA-binding transcriptional regulator YhcF (GntR family)